MEIRPITEKPKKHKGIGSLLIILLLLGFVVSVYLFGKGLINEIIHP